MKYLFFGLILFCGLFSQCNKVIDEIPQPPFTAFPNPFIDVFTLNFGPNVPNSAEVAVRITDSRDAELAMLDDVDPNQSLSFNLDGEEKGMYFVQVTIDEQLFLEPILKVE